MQGSYQSGRWINERLLVCPQQAFTFLGYSHVVSSSRFGFGHVADEHRATVPHAFLIGTHGQVMTSRFHDVVMVRGVCDDRP